MAVGQGVTFAVKPVLDKTVTDKVKAQISELSKSQDINLRVQGARLEADLKKAQAQIAATTKDRDVKIKAKVDAQNAQLAFKSLETEAKSALKSVAKDAESTGKSSGLGFVSNFSDVFTNPAVLTGGIAAALALLPGVVALSGATTGIALGTAIALSTDKTLQAQGKGIVTQLKTTLGDAVRESGFSDALSGAMTQVSAVITKIGPEFRQTFSDVAPLLKPVVTMVSDLASNALPGFNSMLRDAQGPLTTFFNSAGKIVGTNLGKFFRELGAGLNDSLPLITDLLRVTTSLLPVIARFADGIASLGHGLAELPGLLKVANSGLDTLAKKMNIPAGNKTGLQVLSEGLSWLEKHIPAGNKSITDLITEANKGDKSVKNLGGSIANAAVKIPATSTALWELASKINDNVTASNKARQAWDKYIGVMTGSFGSLQALQDDMSTLAGDIRKVSGSLDGNSKAARQYHADLDTALNDSESYIAKLRDQATAAGNTKAAQSALSQGIKGTIAQLIPAASKSATARAEVLALARANGINASSFADLTNKVGSSTDATHKMTSASNKLTTASANATGASKTLKQKIDDLGTSLHLTKGKTDDLYNSIKNLPKNKRVTIDEIISGKGKVSISGNWATQTQSNGATQSVNVKTGQSQYRSPNGYSYAQGGPVTGPGTSTSDSIPARLSNGEYVINAAAVRKVGKKHLDTVNSGALFGYAGGGLVNNSQTGAGVAAGNRSLIHDTVKFTIPTIQSLSQSAVNQAMRAMQQAFASSVAYNASAGVRQWLPDVLKALALNHLPSSLANQVLRQISTESGGNPNAVNLTDSNARAGHPSQGLLQTIPSTFSAYHISGTSMNIRDPLANIAAAINYARHVYGPGLMRGGMGLGSGHGYFGGGTVHGGMPSADKWSVNVSEGERVLTRSQAQGYDKAPVMSPGELAIIQRLDQQNKLLSITEKNTRDTAAGVGGKNAAIRRVL